jgi:hypothetical protein
MDLNSTFQLGINCLLALLSGKNYLTFTYASILDALQNISPLWGFFRVFFFFLQIFSLYEALI